MSFQCGQKQPFAAEKHGFKSACPLDVILNPLRKGHNAAGIHHQPFAVQLFFNDGAASMNKRHAVTFQALKNKSFAAEETGPKFPVKGNGNFCAKGCAQKRIFLAGQLSADGGHVNGNNFSGIGRGKGHSFFVMCLVGEMGQKQAFTGERPFACAKELAHKPFVRFRTVPHFCFKCDALLHPVHGTGLGNHRFAGIQPHLNGLHVIPENFVIHFMALHRLPPLSLL